MSTETTRSQQYTRDRWAALFTMAELGANGDAEDQLCEGFIELGRLVKWAQEEAMTYQEFESWHRDAANVTQAFNQQFQRRTE